MLHLQQTTWIVVNSASRAWFLRRSADDRKANRSVKLINTWRANGLARAFFFSYRLFWLTVTDAELCLDLGTPDCCPSTSKNWFRFWLFWLPSDTLLLCVSPLPWSCPVVTMSCDECALVPSLASALRTTRLSSVIVASSTEYVRFRFSSTILLMIVDWRMTRRRFGCRQRITTKEWSLHDL